MNTMVVDSRVKQVVSNIRNLPTPPIVFQQIQKALTEPDASAKRIAGILAEDPAISARVLKLTNSSFYGLSREIESVKEAVVIVGLEAIRNLVLSASVLDMFRNREIDRAYQESFWRHSLATAFCSRILAQKLRTRETVDADAAFSSGLLHDIGKMILTCCLPDECTLFQKARAEDNQVMDHELEARVLGYTHADIGGFLATQWKLPARIREAIARHHVPQSSGMDEPIAYVVHVADYVAKAVLYHKDQQHLVGIMDPAVVEFFGISDDDIAVISDLLRDEYAKAETFMRLAGFE
jgi:putative nucleotidyltransferase with HDIG domain